MFHWFIKRFGKKVKARPSEITKIRYCGGERQFYNQQTNEWVFWYLLLLDDGIDCTQLSRDEALVARVSDSGISCSGDISSNASLSGFASRYDNGNYNDSYHSSSSCRGGSSGYSGSGSSDSGSSYSSGSDWQ